MKVRPFTIAVENSVLDDLRQRLADTRWPDEIPNTGWDYGSNLTYIKELVDYWRTDFDWRAQEAKLNAFNHFKSEVDGLDIHFIHEKGKGPNPIPLIITHGWPSCFFEMTKIIPLLADPASYGGDAADSFDVVAPSLPGFGFSDHAQDRGMEIQRVAGMWNKLMSQNLGYPKFGAQGGDIGSGVTARLGFAHSDTLYGIHLTSITRPTPYLGPGSKPVTDAEQALITQRDKWFQDEGGYNHIQGTKPQTLAYGLNDSPVGLAAWIVEKYRTWSDCGGDVEKSYTKDELLTIVTIYWVTQTISSSTRMYFENQKHLWTMEKDQKVPTPAGMAMFPQEISKPPREWGERSYHVRRWTEMASGGHFAALEEPQLLAEEVRAFFRDFR
ncbi:MAG: epoxide hydrolase [Dehalococcoidia bacterium]|uniref:Epoxide hydrolase N-terminal domain-containing protein n=1 Tax=marine metagenome TaxID=408172 RepID=A0A381R8Y8_9ZZZZ|nr:epoxide hydrolase [Dehalococcoidia bacterium]MCS5668478.1 epoxide hydrolase [Dehalococcoidia bacterium]MEC9238629.1 epoxide hydrolase [Chloroflexota bacterium]MED5587374.1 epoxide hydrolase [Chloroflexota bacterium]MEE3167921.1 epoxide hydrolase [Chloroflexota bacterium]|tara:strand:- start:676 stop:1827 length:1152 start_codon:yes stop_codon:yes gene_type:complete